MLVLGLCWAAGTANADESSQKHPLQPAITTSPRATLKSFLETCHEAYEVVRQRGMRRDSLSEGERNSYRIRIYGCLDLSEVPPTLKANQADETVAYLKEVLDRLELPPESEWPGEAEVDSKKIDRWIIPHTEITIARVQDGPQQGTFQFSPDTVERAAEFYERVRHLPYQDRPTVTPSLLKFFIAEPGALLPRSWIASLPEWAHERPGGQAVWQWVGFALSLLVSILLLGLVCFLGIRETQRRGAGEVHLFRYIFSLAIPLIAMLIPVWANSFIENQLRISGDVLVGVTYLLDLVFLFALVIVVWGASNRLAAIVIATPWIQTRGLDAQIVRLAFRMLGIAGAIVVILDGGQRIGIPLTTLLAGAGVSGLALALAAQDTLKNVLGSIMIALDKPYRIGERIVVQGYDGFVEEVGLRSTKIRLLTGHLTTIPNEEMARRDIENVSRRPYIRRVADIPIPLETPPELIERAVQIVREILSAQENLTPDRLPQVRFNEINRDSFNIRFFVWYSPPDYWEYLAFCEAVNQRIVEAFDKEGIPFAPPTTATYLTQNDDRPLNFQMLATEPLSEPQTPQK